MATKLDGREILKKLNVKSDRVRTTLYLSKAIYEEFKSHCAEVAPSQVVEELMKHFIATTPRKK